MSSAFLWFESKAVKKQNMINELKNYECFSCIDVNSSNLIDIASFDCSTSGRSVLGNWGEGGIAILYGEDGSMLALQKYFHRKLQKACDCYNNLCTGGPRSQLYHKIKLGFGAFASTQGTPG